MKSLQDIRNYAGDLALGVAPMNMLRLALQICSDEVERATDALAGKNAELHTALAELERVGEAAQTLLNRLNEHVDEPWAEQLEHAATELNTALSASPMEAA